MRRPKKHNQKISWKNPRIVWLEFRSRKWLMKFLVNFSHFWLSENSSVPNNIQPNNLRSRTSKQSTKLSPSMKEQSCFSMTQSRMKLLKKHSPPHSLSKQAPNWKILSPHKLQKVWKSAQLSKKFSIDITKPIKDSLPKIQFFLHQSTHIKNSMTISMLKVKRR